MTKTLFSAISVERHSMGSAPKFQMKEWNHTESTGSAQIASIVRFAAQPIKRNYFYTVMTVTRLFTLFAKTLRYRVFRTAGGNAASVSSARDAELRISSNRLIS